jgi:hypothetical protein
MPEDGQTGLLQYVTSELQAKYSYGKKGGFLFACCTLSDTKYFNMHESQWLGSKSIGELQDTQDWLRSTDNRGEYGGGVQATPEAVRRPFVYSAPYTTSRDFYARLCTPVHDRWNPATSKSPMYDLFNELHKEGTGLPLQEGGEFAIVLVFLRLPWDSNWTDWFFKKLENLEHHHRISTHIFATLFAEHWNNAPLSTFKTLFDSRLISGPKARELQASVTYLTLAMEVVMSTGHSARCICK